MNARHFESLLKLPKQLFSGSPHCANAMLIV